MTTARPKTDATEATPRESDLHVPLVDLRATYLPIRERIHHGFEAVFESMRLFNGENIVAFEKEFTEYCGARFGLACSNGTDAVTLALKAFDFPPGFEAIVPSHTFFATVESVVHAGGVPVMVDIDPNTYCLDPARVTDALTDKTAVIMPVHIYGHPADMDAICEIARDRDLVVIEDAAQAHGARFKDRPCGGLADAAAFSFYVTKNLGAFGEAGFCTARDPNVFERMQLLRHHGHVGKFDHAIIGHNLRMDELQAVILRAKLPNLDANNARRREIARRYEIAFADLPLVTPKSADWAQPNHHCYVVLTDHRDDLRRYLTERRIGTGIHYQKPVHAQPALAAVPHTAHPMPVTESVCARCLTLPCWPEMSDPQIEHVIDSVRAFFADAPARHRS